jgi:hypothetical protein
MHLGKRTLAIALIGAFVTQAHGGSAPSPSFSASPIAHQPKPHFRFPTHSHSASDSILFDQSGVADAIAPVQNYQSEFDIYDSEGADDFIIADPAGWTVGAINFQMLYNGSPEGDTYDVTFYEDANGSPGQKSCEYAGLSGVLDASETALSIALPAPCELASGHYWVALSANLDFPLRAYWSVGPGSAVDSIGNWREPGDGNETGCIDWTPMSACTTPDDSTIGFGEQNLLFQIVGSVGMGGSCGAGELCLAATVGADLTPEACASTQTIDATVGDQLNFCYTITNNTGIALDYHTLQNNIDGSLFSLTNQPVPAGATFQFNHVETVGETSTYNSTWTGQDVRPGYVAAVESSSGDCSDRIFTDGFDPDASSCSGGNFVDITQTGTALGLDEEGLADVTMPFSFNFYGTTSNLVSISNKGGIVFASDWGLPFLNSELPAVVIGAPAIMPLWDDFASDMGDVFYDTRGVAPNRRFIVEWFDRVHVDGQSNTDGATFELILDEDGTIHFEYADVAYSGFDNSDGDPDDCTGGICATIGLQNDMTLYNQFSAFKASVTDHSGIKWTPAMPQIYTATDSVVVNAGAPEIVVNPSPVTGSVTAGASSTISFAVENHGNRDLNWSVSEAMPSNLHFPLPGTRFSMPLGDPAKVSAGPAPAALHARRPGKRALQLPFGGAVPTFAFDISNLQFETFDALAPGNIDVVATTDYTYWVGGAFVNGDFSKFYVLGGSGFVSPDTANTLATIDTATGAKTVIGQADSNGFGWNGMAWDSTSGKLYAVSGCGSNSNLVTIDIGTGAATPIGTLSNELCTIAIAVDADGNMYGLDLATDALYAIDKTTGDDALIGSIGFNTNYMQDMAFDPSTGILYLAGFDEDAFTDNIYTIDVTTGLASIVGPLGTEPGEVDAMGIETIAGPCGKPQDLPWLSLGPLSGTTVPDGSSPVTATIDGTNASAGDVLSGTICVRSNDPAQPNHLLATPITVDVY